MLNLGDTENRFSPELLETVNAHLDTVERDGQALVTVGAAAMLAVAHDFRVMREDRGFFCFPEIDINIPFTPGMAALIQAKVTPQTAVESMTTGRRYGGGDAVAAGLVDAAAPEDALVDAALARLTPILGKDRGTLSAIKSTMYDTVVATLRTGR